MLGPGDESQSDKKSKKPGRKTITDDAPTKRTAQNRAAQRAFRERKQQHLQSLEDKVKELTEQRERTERENQQLRQRIDALSSENSSLKGAKFTYENPPVSQDSAITNLLDLGGSPGVDLTSMLELPPAGSHSAGLATMAPVRKPTLSASPQNVPVLYPLADPAATTVGTLASGLIQQSAAAASA
ncbi:DNA-binding transcription factor yap1, partial [Coemansia nantahalensis]